MLTPYESETIDNGNLKERQAALDGEPVLKNGNGLKGAAHSLTNV